MQHKGALCMREVHELYGAYDEADTRVAFHSLHVDVNDQGNTVIRCYDTDIPVGAPRFKNVVITYATELWDNVFWRA